jgi:hypothetical protein
LETRLDESNGQRFGRLPQEKGPNSMNMNSGDQTDTTPASTQDIVSFDVRHLSEQQLAALGVSHIAYVKPVMVNGVRGFAIHAADGTPMAVAGDRDVAVAAVMQHEMLAVSVH